MILLLIAYIGITGLGYLVIRGASERLVPSAFALKLVPLPEIDSKLTMANIYGKMSSKPDLSISKKYRLRCGHEVIGLIFEVQDPENRDGFNWCACYVVDGTDRHVWVNNKGQWSNNPFYLSEMDLVEVTE
jgi:hypothetical protein